MRLDTGLRLAFYLTLGLACACLTYAELDFLEWMPAALVVTGVLLVLAFRIEGRWSFTPEQANALALVIALGAGMWFLFQLPHSEEEIQASDLPWPTGLLPHVGPLLILLLLVKVFRPKKIADFWGMQIIGLMMVTLGCILTGDPLFGLFLLLYLGCLCWCLALFYWFREQGRGDRSEALSFMAADPGLPAIPWRRLGLGQAVRWTALVAAGGLLIFLLAPRPVNYQWDPGRLAAVPPKVLGTGLQPGLDLNRTGQIHVSERLAFSVVAFDEQGSKDNLDPQQRWRAEALDYYEKGRWYSWVASGDPREIDPVPKVPRSGKRNNKGPGLPHLGADQYFLTFTVRPNRAGLLVLAEPVLLEPDAPVDVLGPEPPSLFHEVPGAGTLISHAPAYYSTYMYRQAVLPPPGLEMNFAQHVEPWYLKFLLNQRIPTGISSFTWSVVEHLPGLTPKDWSVDDRGYIRKENRLKVARALCRFLAASGQYTYTLHLRRVDRSLDPTVDFLINVKQGNCARYAGALALMLRSMGVPGRVVQGYRGAEKRGQGLYYIRQRMAHSWVEVLVPDRHDEKQNYWLVLDPTPTIETADKGFTVFLDWLSDNWYKGRVLWREFILDYNNEQQQMTAKALWKSMTDSKNLEGTGRFLIRACAVVGLFLIALVAWLVWRRLRVRSRTARAAVASLPAGVYSRLLAVLARRCGLKPRIGQTPLEFGSAAAALLAPALPASLADLPVDAARLFYRERYGGHPLEHAEEERINLRIKELDEALKKGKGH